MFAETASHPGQVTVIAPDGTETVQSAEKLPNWIKFARTRDGRTVPVILIARFRSPNGYTFRSYAEDGRLVAISSGRGELPTAPPERVSGWF
jgi:hypothetical protein